MSEISSLTPIIGVGVMLFDKSEKILLGLRVKAGEETSWCFPGGKIEANESLEQSAARELHEETGLKLNASNIKAFTLLIDQASPRINTTIGLSAKLSDDHLKDHIRVTEPEIFEKWAWFDLSELPANLFPASEAMLNVWKTEKLRHSWISYPIHNKE